MRKNKRQICKEEFDKVSMQIHRATIHNIANKKHKWEICEKDFKTQNTLRYHFTTIHYNKGIHCNICARNFHNRGVVFFKSVGWNDCMIMFP